MSAGLAVQPRDSKEAIALGKKDAQDFIAGLKGLDFRRFEDAVDDRMRSIENLDPAARTLRVTTEHEELKRELKSAIQSREEDAGRWENPDDPRNDPDYHGGVEDVANWVGPKGTWS